MKQLFLASAVLLFAISAVTVEASTVLRSGNAVSVANDQLVEANFYAWGNTVTISGEMAGDVVVAGGSITINGNVTDDVLALGGTVTVSGEIGDDVRVMAGDVIVEGVIEGSLTVFAGRVKILSNTVINGDMVVYGGDVIFEGTVNGQVLGTVSNLRLNGTINNNVDVSVNTLTLGERAVMAGNLTYVSQNDVVRAANASVAGEVTRNDPVLGSSHNAFRVIAMTTLMILFGALSVYLIARQRVLLFTREVLNQPLWRSTLIGFAVLVTTPFIVGVLVASVLGILVGLIIFLLFLFLLAVSIILLPVTIGAILAMLFRSDISKMFLLWVIVGSLTLIMLLLLYVIGPILILTFSLITLGTLAQYFFTKLMKDERAK